MKRSTHTHTHLYSCPSTWVFVFLIFFQLKLSWCIGQELRHKRREETCGHRVGKEREGRNERVGWTYIHSVQFSSVAQSCPTLCDPMNRSTPGLSVHHQLPEFTQTHVHRVSDAIQPFHPLSSPSPPAPNPSQHQSLFQWVNSSHEVAKVLEFQL